jgi:hypothetical protein
VTSIGVGAFENCSGLTEVIIPDGVTSIADNAFKGCSNLTSITIPASVKTIGDNAFDGCSNLTSIIIPEGVTSIGKQAFRNTGLQEVILPDPAFRQLLCPKAARSRSSALPVNKTYPKGCSPWDFKYRYIL